ncbi:hypothetical protein ACHHYP_07126 [Achlya hypogyna]|uniref:Mediator of RNA polymerase II transcription subunit 20 n=1 Tax=Achlya hypogyna TaxID=1202772 RepID=A0A1V9ZMT6_ACHHY|nr:hypothetical protein ACHHYP_07126 [Achlya hypogyna]
MTGMTRVYILSDSNIPVRYQNLLKKMDEMGARKVDRHVVHSQMLSRKVLVDGYSNQRMYLLRTSQNNDLIYAVLGNEKTELAMKVESSENGLDGLLDECCLLECGLEGSNILQQVEIYVPKSYGKFEGMQFVFGDFTIGICTFVCRGSTPTGLVLEIQYTPCSVLSDPSQDKLLDELLVTITTGTETTPTANPADSITKPVANLLALFDKVGLPAQYSLKHTAIQYVAAFNILRK